MSATSSPRLQAWPAVLGLSWGTSGPAWPRSDTSLPRPRYRRALLRPVIFGVSSFESSLMSKLLADDGWVMIPGQAQAGGQLNGCKRPLALNARHVDAERHADDLWAGHSWIREALQLQDRVAMN